MSAGTVADYFDTDLLPDRMPVPAHVAENPDNARRMETWFIIRKSGSPLLPRAP